MKIKISIKDCRGGDELSIWCGYEPSFHDSEIVEVHIVAQGTSWISVLMYCPRVGAFIALVRIEFEQITDLGLDGFFSQNVLDEIALTKTDERVRVEFPGITGLGGYVECRGVSLGL